MKNRCCKDNVVVVDPAPTTQPNPTTPTTPQTTPPIVGTLPPSPTGAPTTAPPTQNPTTGAPTVYICPYEKDKSLKCFDETHYTCKSCCTTGLSEKTFVSCWNFEFTKEACCIPAEEITSAPDTPPEAPVCVYDKDSSCWDAQYTCESCCTTDKSNGFNCWSAGYTKSRCCRSVPNAAGVQFQEIPDTVYTSPPVASPSASCPYNKDAECWGGIYICQQCCTSGQSTFGTSCFDATYTRERCCSNYVAPVTAPPVFAPPVVVSPGTSTCPYFAGVSECFTSLYPCETCCTTGLDAGGTTSCWDATYNAARCCITPAVVSPPFVSPPFVVPATAPPVFVPPVVGACQDTLDVCTVWASIGECNGAAAAYVKDVCRVSCNSCSGRRSTPAVWSGDKDSRGLPLDSRGNPLLPTRYVRVPAERPAQSTEENSDSSTLLIIGIVGGVTVLAAAVILVVYRHRKTAMPGAEMSDQSTNAATPPDGVGTRPWRGQEGEVAVC